MQTLVSEASDKRKRTAGHFSRAARLASIIGVLATLIACVTAPSDHDVSKADADAALQYFGRSNPECLAWTDWSQTCSRLRPDDQHLHCNAAISKVKRSEPFCLAIKGAEDPQFVALDAGSVDAFNRFCIEFRQLDGQSVCFSRDPDRPFAGFRISELRHPFCEIWGNKDGQYCTEKPDESGLPSCEEMGTAQRVTSPLTCFKQNRPVKREANCTGMMSAVVDNYPSTEAHGIILPVIRQQTHSPTANIYCKAWERQ